MSEQNWQRLLLLYVCNAAVAPDFARLHQSASYQVKQHCASDRAGLAVLYKAKQHLMQQAQKFTADPNIKPVIHLTPLVLIAKIPQLGRRFLCLLKVSITPQPNVWVDWQPVHNQTSQRSQCRPLLSQRLWSEALGKVAHPVADGDHNDRSSESVLINRDWVIVSSQSHPLSNLQSPRIEVMGSLLDFVHLLMEPFSWDSCLFLCL